MLAFLLVTRLGSRNAVVVAGLLGAAGWGLVAAGGAQYGRLGVLYTGRLVCGLGMGLGGTVHPGLACQLCQPGLRGPLGGSGVIGRVTQTAKQLVTHITVLG